MTDWLLVVKEENKDPVSIPVVPGMTVGRAEDNTIALEDPFVGRHQLRVIQESGTFFVEDLGSSSQTRIDQREALSGERCPLEPGMVLRVGHTVIECVSPSAQGTIRVGGPVLQPGAKPSPPTRGSFHVTMSPIAEPGSPAEPPPAVAASPSAPSGASSPSAPSASAPSSPVPPPPPVSPGPPVEKSAATDETQQDPVASSGTVFLQHSEQEGDMHEGPRSRLKPRLLLLGLGMKKAAPITCSRFVIGRAEKAHLALPTPTLSSEHACIHFDGTGFLLQDLQSTNGTWLGDSRLAKGETAKLSGESMLKFGSIEALFIAENPDDAKQRDRFQSQAAAALVKQAKITPRQRTVALQLAKSDGRHIGETLLMQTDLKISDWVDALETAQQARGWFRRS